MTINIGFDNQEEKDSDSNCIYEYFQLMFYSVGC